MSHIAESVPLADIWKIESYINKEGLPLREVLRRTGASWGVNGLMWNGRDGKICNLLKADGQVVFNPDPPYTARGYAWETGPDIHMERVPCAARNYLACTELIVDGQPVAKPIYTPQQGGRRGRTAIGTKNGRFCAYISGDGTADARTPEELRDLLADYGWRDAVMLDSGGSSQGVLNGRSISSGRIVKHILLVYLLKDKPAPESGYEPTVKAYSKSRDGKQHLTEHFTVREFACRDGSDPVFIATALPQVLEAIREHFGKPVRITSGYRTPPYNQRVGGKTYSQHLYGMAADIVIDGVSPAEVGRYARSLMPHHGGIGIYDTDKHFTHIDVRKVRADWRD